MPAPFTLSTRRRHVRRHGHFVPDAQRHRSPGLADACRARFHAAPRPLTPSRRVCASVEVGIAALLRTCNRHSFERQRHVRRGFLPRGLSNTCPQIGAARTAGMSRGQVSNKPKRLQTFASPNSTPGSCRSTPTVSCAVRSAATEGNQHGHGPCWRQLDQPVRPAVCA